MRTFRFLGMALLAVVMCMNFTSCGSDDDNEIIKDGDGVIINQKRLVEMKEINENKDDTHIDLTSLSYDGKGKLMAIVYKCSDSKTSNITNLTWGENTVTEASSYDTITYSINDGLARTGLYSKGENYLFTYNPSKKLTTYQKNENRFSNTQTITWKNDMITEISENENERISTITYSNQTAKGYFPLITLMVEDDFNVILAHPELFGMRVAQLPSQVYTKDIYKNELYDVYFKEIYKYENISEETTLFTYKLTSDGYVESVTMRETDVETKKYSFKDKNYDNKISDDERNIIDTDTYIYTTTYTFKWE